ncbi:MAG: hypothetical protein AAGN15_27640 [Cyanobacteria bacterium J06581_3]
MARSDGVGPVSSVSGETPRRRTALGNAHQDSGCTHPDLRYAPATPPEGIASGVSFLVARIICVCSLHRA